MASKNECSVCAYERGSGDKVDTSRSKREWGRITGTSEASVRRHLKHAPVDNSEPGYGYKETWTGDEGTIDVVISGEKISNDAILRKFGHDPEQVQIVGTLEETHWQMAGEWQHRYRFKTSRRSEEIDLPALYAAVSESVMTDENVALRHNWQFRDERRATVVVWSDPQVGKTGRRGGTRELIERSEIIRDKLDSELLSRKPSRVLLADAGDGIEGFESGGNPMFTNDLSLAGQLDLYSTELFKWIEIGLNSAPVTVMCVPSNHAAWRNGKQTLGKPGDDLGIFTHRQVEKIVRAANLPVDWVYPDEYDESVAVNFEGTTVGLVHGNQFGPGQGTSWWEKQAFGAQAVARADVLVAGHYHSFSANVAGRNPDTERQRWFLGAPTLDNGSDWFRQRAGRDSDPGLMIFDVTDQGFDLSSLTIISC